MSTLWLKYMQHGHDASSVMKWVFFNQPSLRLCWSQNVQKMVLSRVFPVFVCSFWATIVCGGSTWQTPWMTVDLKGSFWGLIHTKCSISIRMQVYPSIWIEVLRFGCSVKTTGYAERKKKKNNNTEACGKEIEPDSTFGETAPDITFTAKPKTDCMYYDTLPIVSSLGLFHVPSFCICVCLQSMLLVCGDTHSSDRVT